MALVRTANITEYMTDDCQLILTYIREGAKPINAIQKFIRDYSYVSGFPEYIECIQEIVSIFNIIYAPEKLENHVKISDPKAGLPVQSTTQGP